MQRLKIVIISLLFISGCSAYSPATQSAVPDLAPFPWVYLRDGRLPADNEQTVSVIAVGDVLLGRGVAAQSAPLQHAAPWLAEADLALGNLEGVLVSQDLVERGLPRQAPAGEPQPLILAADPSAAAHLPRAGFDILSLANNHSLDYGEEGLQETVDHLHEARINTIGVTGATQTAVPLLHQMDGLTLALLAFNAVADPHPELACPPGEPCSPSPAAWDPPISLAEIAAARSEADALIVSIHWGYEYQPQPDPQQERIARAMLEAGADLIIGHHPHVPQTISVQENRVVAYSLGNFLFDQSGQDTVHGLALRALFDKQGLRALQAIPLHAGLEPRFAAMAEAETWLSPLLPPAVGAASRLTYACEENGCTAVDALPAGEDGRFFSGQIDLTGDGQPETVRRQGEQVTVYEGGAPAWFSPDEWRVMDVALGDPNDDGRYEMMLAIRQKDAAGHERSQPYIVGHRGGRYNLLWGGRPLADPIQELAVGDVDGDGKEELIVIEELADGSAQALSVWRWSGWTFSLVWRGEPGSYSDLVLVPADQKHVISLKES